MLVTEGLDHAEDGDGAQQHQHQVAVAAHQFALVPAAKALAGDGVCDRHGAILASLSAP